MIDHIPLIAGALGVGICLLVLWRGYGAERHRADEATDGATGLLTRRRFDLDVEAHARRGDEPTAIVLIDLDPPVSGHPEADDRDDLVVAVGAIVNRLVRQGDVAYRYGGERFSILLPATGSAAAALVAERIRRSIEVAALPCERRVTVSAGVAAGAAHEAAAVLCRADDALLAAQRDGRNVISIA